MKMKFPYIVIKRSGYPAFILLLCLFTITFQSCKKKRSEMANILFKKTQNNLFKKLDPDDFAVVFKHVLDSDRANLANPVRIKAYYANNQYDPALFLAYVQNGGFKTMLTYFDKADEHGLDSNMFDPARIRALSNKFNDKNSIKTVDEAYHDIAELELLTANSLINYTNYLQFGLISPKRIYSRYFIATKRPDSNSIKHVLQARNLVTYLDSIQPKDPQYKILQKAFLSGTVIPGLSKDESQRLLLISMERLRWQNKPSEVKYVLVNIPDFKLDVIDSGKSVLNMKVCVGQGRNMDNAKTLIHFDDTDRVDKPNPHETPLLNSVIHSVQVNPVWNIPESIANKEIMVEAAEDPYYLANKNIDVYKNGDKIPDPETIDWSTANKSDFEFKQKPGADNSLGKIKFLFNNHSNVYLHDTPAKSAFYKAMRAVSHGCVRLGNPEGLALALFGQSDEYNTIDEDMKSDNPAPTDIDLPNKTAVYITYTTCWADSTGAIQYRPDVYGLDIVLYAHMEKILDNVKANVARLASR
jgi:murein L,D-transpeptidase YcbB/YkuD